MSTSCVTNFASTNPDEIVFATARPKNAPNKFVTAASMIACRGVSTFVPTTVAMAFRRVVKPLVYVKINATNTTVGRGITPCRGVRYS
jgi:hypothetical protein